MRRTILALLLVAAVARPDDPLAPFLEDKAKRKELETGLALMKNYYALVKEVEKAGGSKGVDKRDKAMLDLLAWLEKTPATLGMDLMSKPDVFLEFFDRGRVDLLPTPQMGKLEYFDRDPVLRRDFEYATLTPQAKAYRPKEQRYPLILTMHGRVINPKHPAFRNDTKLFPQRSRAVVHDYWLNSPLKDDVVVVAPTGLPIGFEFSREENYFNEVTILFQALGAALDNYRIDWNRIFLEVQGPAFRVCCEYPLLFAGLIVRDGRIPDEEYVMLENLNGTPLCYVADAKKWEKGGKKLADALTAAYAAAGAPENLLILQGQEDANGALKADDEKIASFVRSHIRPKSRSRLRWRFFRGSMTAAGCFDILRFNETYAPGIPLDKTAGALTLEVKQGTCKGADGAEKPCTLFDVQITEAESFILHLDDYLAPLDLPMTVNVNGKAVLEGVTVKREPRYFIEQVLPRRFFFLPYVGSLTADFPLRPQYQPPEQAQPAPTGAGQDTGGAGGPAGEGGSAPDTPK